jgi:glutamine amidotransferase
VTAAIIDYGVGNLRSVERALAAAGAVPRRVARPDDASDASLIVIPGVGHFDATRALDPWRDFVADAAAQGRAVLGICLGMQWLFEGSDESASTRGLGVLAGRCTRLSAGPRVKVPHVGWNMLSWTQADPLFDGVPIGAAVYFTHTYAAPVTADTVAVTEHGERFTSAVRRGRCCGVQWHPEKSGDIGLRVLRNAIAMAEGAC